jgi:hypothetical protein
MPLKDHAKLKDQVLWGEFHPNWAVKIVDRLNEAILSDRYNSKSNSHLGARAEVDIGTWGRDDSDTSFESPNGHRPGGVAVEAAAYAPPAPPLSSGVSFADADYTEVLVSRGRWELVAAIELVSESNKDRSDHRATFAAKCAGYLAAGVSVVVVDVVTQRVADLHQDLCSLLDLPAALQWESPTGLSTICYRTVQGTQKPGLAIGNGQVRLDIWPHALAVGAELPTVPLWLAADLAVPLELDLTYAAACKSLRLA